MNYPEALDWLYGCQRIGIKLGLENTHKLLEALEIDPSGTLLFHIAGTNGKGSTCAFLESICQHHGFRTGLFTSPHLVSFAERIRIDGLPMAEAVLAKGITELRSLVHNWDPHPTFFELVTALGMRCFLDAAVQTIILETGMGGRLDSTNALPHDVAVITPIGMDHQQFLGDTLGKIAAEKAGILKPGKPCVTGQQDPEAMAVIAQVAQQIGAPLHRIESPLPESTQLGLTGPHQFWNAALAVRAIEVSPVTIPDETIRAGLAATTLPARFQELQTEQGSIIIDGAHNVHAAQALVEAWKARFGDTQAALVFGGMRDKDIEAVVDALAPITARIFPATTPTDRGLTAPELRSRLGLAEDGPDAIGDVLQVAQASGMPVLVAGSIFLAGAALEALGWSEQPFEPSLQ